jgi:hypothetical protein
VCTNLSVRAHLHAQTHFEGCMLTPDEIIAFVLCDDTFLSIHQITQLIRAI